MWSIWHAIRWRYFMDPHCLLYKLSTSITFFGWSMLFLLGFCRQNPFQIASLSFWLFLDGVCWWNPLQIGIPCGFWQIFVGFHSFHPKGPKDPKGSPRGPGAAALRGGALRQLQRLLRLALGWPSGVLGRFSGGWENVRGGHGCGESGGCLGTDLGGWATKFPGLIGSFHGDLI